MERIKIVQIRRLGMATEDSVSPVIGSILMVVIVVALSAVLWLMVSSMFSTNVESKTTVMLAVPRMERQNRAGMDCWDTTLDIIKVSPSDSEIPWNAISISIKDASGSLRYPQTAPAIDMGAYPNDLTVRTWYVETAIGGPAMQGGDEIKVTSMAIYYEGALVQLCMNGQVIGSVALPTTFP
jgi:hypothetical protein